jgi:hypothetical protein
MNKLLWVFLLSFLPYIGLSFFVHPTADDFTNAVAVIEKGFWKAQYDVYLNWFGRYSSTFLMYLNPTIDMQLWLYRLYCVLSILFLVFSVQIFVNWMMPSLYRSQKIIVSLGFSSIFISRMPSVVEGFFWIPGLTNYTVGISLLLMASAYILKSYNLTVLKATNSETGIQWSQLPILTLASFAICGINEIIMLLWGMFLLSIFIYDFRKFKIPSNKLILLGLVSAVFAAIVILSPGNQIRASMFEGSFNLPLAVGKSFLFGFMYMFRFFELASVILIIFSCQWISANSSLITPGFASSKFRKWLYWALFVVLVLAIFPAFYGMDSRPPRRALNVICFFHNLIFALLFLSLYLDRSSWLHSLLNKFSFLGKVGSKNLLLWVFLISFFAIGNHRRALVDLTMNAKSYSDFLNNRYLQLKQQSGQDVVVSKLEHRPITICFDDIESDPQDWKNQSYAKIFGLKSIKTQ